MANKRDDADHVLQAFEQEIERLREEIRERQDKINQIETARDVYLGKSFINLREPLQAIRRFFVVNGQPAEKEIIVSTLLQGGYSSTAGDVRRAIEQNINSGNLLRISDGRIWWNEDKLGKLG